MLEHQLSTETLTLIEQAVDVIGGRLAIYHRHNWAIERHQGSGSLAFDPTNDSRFLQGELRRIIDHGAF